MNELIAFATEQWFLFAALMVILALLAQSIFGSWGLKNVPPSEAVALINRQNAVVLDVRTDDEYKQGHIVNSVHIPVGMLPHRMTELQKHKAHPLVVICRSGNRSNQACALLRKQGFDAVYGLAGGIVAWQNANLPLEKK